MGYAKEPVTQPDPMGCGIACIAFALGLTYPEAKSLFDRHDGTRPDCFCPDMVRALKRGGLDYRWRKIQDGERIRYLPNSIVFVRASKKLPAGHYLARAKDGSWMDPWINLDIRAPDIRTSKAGYRKRLPGKAAYYIFPLNIQNTK